MQVPHSKIPKKRKQPKELISDTPKSKQPRCDAESLPDLTLSTHNAWLVSNHVYSCSDYTKYIYQFLSDIMEQKVIGRQKY